MDLIDGLVSIPSGKNSYSSSFEVYAAVGGHPDTFEVQDLFVAASDAVLNIESEGNLLIHLSSEVEVIDGDKLGVYFGSGDGIACFSIVVNVLVASDYEGLGKVRATARNFAKAAESAVAEGKFAEALKSVEASIEVLLMELAPDSSPSDENDYDDCASSHDEEVKDECVASYDENGNDHCVALCDEDDLDNFEEISETGDDDDLSSMCSTDFDDFLETSYREYLEDLNRKEILERINPPESPPTVSGFPAECSSQTRTPSKVKFDPLVRVKNTLSRKDMTPNETYSYWSGPDESLSPKDREQMLKLLTEKWTLEQEELELDESLLVPMLPEVYTISIKT